MKPPVPLLLLVFLQILQTHVQSEPRPPLKVACLGDSITKGARVDAETQSYPAQLQRMLGDNFTVRNFGVGGATLIKVGRPNIWQQLDAVTKFEPDIAVISLGTNDTVSGSRRNWERIDRFVADYQELIDRLAHLPSRPRILLSTPTAMVLETDGLSDSRRQNLTERKPRLQELCRRIRDLAARNRQHRVTLIELNAVLAGRPDLLTTGDGVHPNADGYAAIAQFVAEQIQRRLTMRPALNDLEAGQPNSAESKLSGAEAASSNALPSTHCMPIGAWQATQP